MYKPRMIEDEKNLHCQMQHQLPVQIVILDPQLKLNQRLLCQQCIDNFESDQNQTIGFKKVVQKLEDKHQQILNSIENIISINIKQVESFQINIINLKSIVLQQLDQLINNAEDWILNLKLSGSKYSEYSFFKELDLFIKKQQSTQDNQIICENRIRLLNNSWITKISSKLASFKLFQEYQPIKNILDNLNEQTSNMFEFSEKQLISPKLCATLEQKDLCYAIVFDPQGKIMVSGCGNKIIIWNFENGQIQEVNSLLEHQKEITCLVYSQISNYFISGSSDGSIRLWNSENNNQWYSSRPYYEHNEWIYCMIITQNEDQLISSSADFTIKIWSIDFINYELTFLYSLSYHTSDVNSLSLNESEKVLVSCGYDSLIIIWQKGVKNQWSFQQIVNQSTQENGYHVRFLKEDQFIWLPSKSNMLCVYQNNNGKFEEIVDKRVLFKKDNQGCVNLPFFPIIFMKNKNLICLRHSLHILLLKELNNGYISIVQELYCQDWSTYGAVTNNGQYLIYWGENKKKYDIYELQYQ